jgi:VIT1/CCC1 family predicted Fe2+/Mn2+ transporter
VGHTLKLTLTRAQGEYLRQQRELNLLLFSIGALIPLLPYLLGFDLLWPGLVCGGVGLLVVGGIAAKFTRGSVWLGSARQLIFGVAAIGITYTLGKFIGTVV